MLMPQLSLTHILASISTNRSGMTHCYLAYLLLAGDKVWFKIRREWATTCQSPQTILTLYSSSTPVKTAGVSMTQYRWYGSSLRGWKYLSDLKFHVEQVSRPRMIQSAGRNHITALVSADCNLLYQQLFWNKWRCDWLWPCPKLNLHPSSPFYSQLQPLPADLCPRTQETATFGNCGRSVGKN